MRIENNLDSEHYFHGEVVGVRVFDGDENVKIRVGRDCISVPMLNVDTALYAMLHRKTVRITITINVGEDLE